MATSGKPRKQPARMLTELVDDPATRHNFDIAGKNIQDIQQAISSKNYSQSVSITTTYLNAVPGALTKVSGLEGRINSSGKPIIIALTPAISAYQPGFYIQVVPGTGLIGPRAVDFFLNRNGATVYTLAIGSAPLAKSLYSGVMILAVDLVGAASYKYELYLRQYSGVGGFVTFSGTQLTIIEL